MRRQDVVWTGSRFIAVGPALGSGSLLDSDDGIHWRSRRSGGANGHPSRLATGRGEVVAVGEIRGEPASWSSPDGFTWVARTPAFRRTLGSNVVTVTDVVAMPKGWLAVGREDPGCHVDCGRKPNRALAWTSPDGLSWTEVPRGPGLEHGGINAAVAFESGYLAVGTDAGEAAIWLSSDGLVWVRVPDDPMFAPLEGSDDSAWVDASGVAADDGVVVVVGMAFATGDGGAPVLMAWHSHDGRSWAPAGVERAAQSQVLSVAATMDGFLATGPSAAPGCASGIWTSREAAIWACSVAPVEMRGFGPYAAAASPAIELVVGLTTTGWDEASGLGMPGAIWWRPVP